MYICNPKREHSSAGLEHLPYKQGVIGSNPITPTPKRTIVEVVLFFCLAISAVRN